MNLLLATVAAVLQLHGPAAQQHPVQATPAQIAWSVSKQVFGRHASTAYCIAGYETGHTYSPTAVSRTNDHGEWQIHDGLRTYGRRIYDIVFNAHVAYRMSKGGTDWSQWTTHSYCGV